MAMFDSPDLLSDPDVQLMLRAQRGDRAAFAELVGAYHGPVVRKLACLLRHEVDAEDVAQEVFFRAYVARQGYQPKGRFAAWLFRIAHNTAHNFRRDRARRREVIRVIDDGLECDSCNPAPGARHTPGADLDERRAETAALVRTALARLNGRQREALLMQHIKGMSCVDIGTALGSNPGAVRSLLARARDNLRRVLRSLKKRSELPGRDLGIAS